VTLEFLSDLLKFRETVLFEKLMEANKTLTPKVGAYNVLMRETSDLMQELALTYGERQTLDYCTSQLAVMKNAENRDVMKNIFLLFGADCIQRDLGFFMMQGVVSKAAAAALTPRRH